MPSSNVLQRALSRRFRHHTALGLFFVGAVAACADTTASGDATSPAAPPGIDILPGVYPNQLSGSEELLQVAITVDSGLSMVGPLLAHASASLEPGAPSVLAMTPLLFRDLGGDAGAEGKVSFSVSELRRAGLLNADTTRLAVRVTAAEQTVWSGSDRLFDAGAWLVDLPAPSGPEAVGTTSLQLADESRPGPNGASRQLMLRVWYPSEETDRQPTGYFLDEQEAERNAVANALPPNVFDRMHRRSVRDAAPASRELRPTLLMSTGWGAPLALYASIAEELASHGYIVIGLGHPDGSDIVVYPDGNDSGFDQATPSNDETVESWAQDFELVLARLTSLPGSTDPASSGALAGAVLARVDVGRIGTFGHSFGGAAAVRAAVMSPLIRASVNVDGSFRGAILERGPTTPVLTLLFEGHSVIDPTPIYFQEHAARGAVYTAEVLGAGHNNFSDHAALVLRLAALDSGIVLADQLVGSITTDRALALQSAYLRAFFGAELSGDASTLMSGPASEFPEVIFGSQAPREP